MKVEEYGKGNPKTIVMLHGANFVHSFGRQYPLSKTYHILVPHLMGFGEHTEQVFQTDACIKELADTIQSLNKKVTLIGFSLGAQLAFRLVSEYQELFESVIIVSPWLEKKEPLLSELTELNLKQLYQLKSKTKCHLIGVLNGLPPKQRKEFVAHMQKVQETTIRNAVDNGITFESVPGFARVSIPMIALAGGKEPRDVQDSVLRMAQINSCCKCEIWEKAAHNIPPMFAKRFNALVNEFLTKYS